MYPWDCVKVSNLDVKRYPHFKVLNMIGNMRKTYENIFHSLINKCSTEQLNPELTYKVLVIQWLKYNAFVFQLSGLQTVDSFHSNFWSNIRSSYKQFNIMKTGNVILLQNRNKSENFIT